ncbi:hypothetical protein [Paenibacillus sp. FSL L8-0708]|uniref:hypothetical protein n=1 Tax=Paenibacillus sp. FSL L8-0708 TaxID=2975311 RepID=UPI0030FA2B86
MKNDPFLQKKLSWLKRQKEIPVIPLSGSGVVSIQGRDIIYLQYEDNGALMAVTEVEDFYLIPAHQYEKK